MAFSIDRYQILEELGQGAMATVYKAYDPRINRELAIKVLRPEHTVNAEFLSRFLRETRAVGKLNHPNIIKIYDVGEFENQPYIAMELLTGQFLDHFMDSGQRLHRRCHPYRTAAEFCVRLRAFKWGHPSRHQTGQHRMVGEKQTNHSY